MRRYGLALLLIAASAGCSKSNDLAGPASTISGTVHGGGGGILTISIHDATVTHVQSTTADAAGHYALSNVPPATYTLTASTSAVDFDPSTRQVTVPPDAAGVDPVIRPSH